MRIHLDTKRFKKVYIEISNICNLQCTFCPTVDRDKKQMTKDALESTLRQVRPWAERVCFHVMGEPLQHPEFSEFVAVGEELDAPLEITTNGTLLKDDKREALLNSAVVQVNFSLQSFADNFPQADAATYLKNIFSWISEARKRRPDLYINLRLWNLGDAGPAAQKNAYFLESIEKEFGIEVNRRVDPGFKKSKNLVDRVYLHFDSRFVWPQKSQPLRSEKGSCHGVRSHVAIHADGRVVPCCLDKEADIVLGDLSKNSFAEIVLNDRTEDMRRAFEAGRLIEDLCQRCTFIERFA